MENIKQVKKAEEEAREIVEAAREESDKKITLAKNELNDIKKLAENSLGSKMERMEKETDEAIGEYEKIAKEGKKIALEKIEVDEGKMDEAMKMILEKMT